MNLSPYQFDGTGINDGTNYRAKLVGAENLLTEGNPNWIDNASGKFATISGTTMGEPKLTLVITCLGTLHSQIDTLKSLFNTQDAPKKFLCKDTADSDRQWYCYAKARKFGPENGKNITIELAPDFSLTADAWLTETETTVSNWDCDENPEWKTVTVAVGNLPALPVFSLTPLDTRAAGYKYRRFIEIVNTTLISAQNYPITFTLDTKALYEASPSKMLTTADDLRIAIASGNGALQEVPRWFSVANPGASAATKVWFNYNVGPWVGGMLAFDIDDDDTSLVINPYVATAMQIPAQNGVLKCGTERMTYTTYNPTNYTFSGLVRAEMDSTAAGHTAGDYVYLIDEIWLMYGNAAATAPAYQNAYFKPIFNLATSTATSRVFETLYMSPPARQSPEQWIPGAGSNFVYGTDRLPWGGVPSTVACIGVCVKEAGTEAQWTLHEPFGITNIVLANLDYKGVRSFDGTDDNTSVRIFLLGDNQSPFYVTYVPATGNAWATLSPDPDITPASTVKYAVFDAYNPTGTPFSSISLANLDTATVTLSSSTTSEYEGVPTVALAAEVTTAYPLDGIINNSTLSTAGTLSAITLSGLLIDAGQTLTVDTRNKTVTYEKTGRERFDIISWDSVREYWLPLYQLGSTLIPTGENVLSYQETDPNIRIVIKWRGRHN